MARQLLKLENVSKGDTGRIVANGAIGFGLGMAQKTVQEQGTTIGGINLGTAMPAIEIAAGVALQFQKNQMLRSIGLSSILVGSYEAGKQGVQAVINGIKPSGSVSARNFRNVPRGTNQVATRTTGPSLYNLYS